MYHIILYHIIYIKYIALAGTPAGRRPRKDWKWNLIDMGLVGQSGFDIVVGSGDRATVYMRSSLGWLRLGWLKIP